jgi:hypothetical protein
MVIVFGVGRSALMSLTGKVYETVRCSIDLGNLCSLHEIGPITTRWVRELGRKSKLKLKGGYVVLAFPITKIFSFSGKFSSFCAKCLPKTSSLREVGRLSIFWLNFEA